MASFIELIAKIKQKNNGDYPLVDAEDIECEDSKRLNVVLNEKLDKNQGAENANKVLGIGADGNVTPVEMSGGVKDYNDLENKPSINGVELKGQLTSEDLGIIAKADNILKGQIKKSLNPSVDDSFLRAMWNLKLYGQSTQGVDPSPTSPQEITAISQFDGAPTGENIAPQNLNVELGTSGFYPVSYEFINNQYVCQLKEGGTTSQFRFYWKQTLPKGTYTINLNFIINGNNVLTSDRLPIFVLNALDNSYIAYGVKGKPTTFTLTQETECYFQSSFYQASLKITSVIVYDLKLELGTTATTYTPYEAQPFTYTPTQPMYSTQDGSISDYVDVEKGVEVYNMYKVVTKPQKLSTEGWFEGTGFIAYRTSVNMTPIANILSNVFVNSHNLGQKNNIYLSINDLPEDLKTLDAIVEYNQTNEIEFYVVLATPTEIPIPQEQLAMLRALYTYNGITNFLCNAPVSFTYERSLQIVINNLENAIGQTNANILLNGGNN